MPAEPAAVPAVVEVTAAVRRVVGARVRDSHDREDLVQAALVRVAAAHERLGDAALQGYAIVTARNVVADHFRRQATHQRHVHRLVEYTTLDGPEELTLQREETDALAIALARLNAEDRRLLLAHEVDGATTADLANQIGSTPGGIAVRLARARARLRLEFLLVFRNVELPTEQCKPVLIALSARERRRQLRLGAGEHLLACPACANLSTPLIERRRSIAGWLPLIGLRPALAALRRTANSGKVQAAVAATTSAGVVAAAVILTAPTSPPQRPATTVVAARTPISRAAVGRVPAVRHPLAITSPLTSTGRPLLPLPPSGLAPFAGQPVVATRVAVLSVPHNEGVWIGTNGINHLWVEFIGPNGPGDTPFPILAGQHLTFTGTLVANSPNFVHIAGLDPDLDAAALNNMGFHIEVPTTAVRIN